MNTSKEQLFKRQIKLAEFGEEGQQKLQEAAVLVVGCGGLGSPIAVHLAASGIGKIHLIDFDVVDLSNLHRQVFYSLDDVGKSKAQCLANFIKNRAPFTEVNYSNKPLTKENVFDFINTVDIVVDGTDSLPTKYLLNDACVIKNKPLVYGSLYKFDGYVASFNVKKQHGGITANLRDAFPTMATDVPNCEEVGTLNAIVSLIASQQVSEVLKIITGIGEPLTNELLIYNSLNNTQLKMKLVNTVSVEVIASIFDKEDYFDADCQIQNSEWLITAEELKQSLLQNPLNLELVSVLENLETPFKVDATYSVKEIKSGVFHPQENKKYVLVCKKGITSYRALQILKDKFPTAAIFSLVGGVNEY